MRQHCALLTPAHLDYPNAGVSLVGAGGRVDELGAVDPWVGRAGGLVVSWGGTAAEAMKALEVFVAEDR